MIEGNIQIDDIPDFKNKDFIIDLSGALEDENGKKDIDKIDNLLNTVHNTNY
jgi:phosphoribosylanthranilate isomerase